MYIYIYTYIYIPGKNFNNDGNQKKYTSRLSEFFPLILSLFCQFYIVFCRFAAFLASERRQPVARMLTYTFSFF